MTFISVALIPSLPVKSYIKMEVIWMLICCLVSYESYPDRLLHHNLFLALAWQSSITKCGETPSLSCHTHLGSVITTKCSQRSLWFWCDKTDPAFSWLGWTIIILSAEQTQSCVTCVTRVSEHWVIISQYSWPLNITNNNFHELIMTRESWLNQVVESYHCIVASDLLSTLISSIKGK